MASKYWIKLYHEILDDPKMGRLPDALFRRAIEFFLIAGERGREGDLPPLADIAWRLRADEIALLAQMEDLEALNILSRSCGWRLARGAFQGAPGSCADDRARAQAQGACTFREICVRRSLQRKCNGSLHRYRWKQPAGAGCGHPRAAAPSRRASEGDWKVRTSCGHPRAAAPSRRSSEGDWNQRANRRCNDALHRYR